MPFVRITLNADRPEPVRDAIADGVHNAMISAIGIPKGDRFQVVDAQPGTALHFDPEYLDVDRRDPVLVEITLAKGRSQDLKRALYQAIAANLAATGVRPEDAMVILHETSREDWTFGNGEMQMFNEPLLRKYGWTPPGE
ncbi:MAG TPA: tautomerase family protein [Pseudonocardiaceae bacterium]|jgi:phenylpyruvate tautomerase PptA (4-oxalocrotonate tautomerase family)